MKHDRINILALLWADVQAKRQLYDTADAGRDAWPVFSAAYKAAHETACFARKALDEAEDVLRQQCTRDGLTAEMLTGMAALAAARGEQP